MITYIKKILFLISLICIGNGYANQRNQEFIIKFGFFAQNTSAEYEMVEHAKTVNILNIKDGHILSLEVTPPDNQEYKLYTIDYFPGEPKVLGGSLSGKSTADFAKGIKAQEIKTKGTIYSPIVFDEGDPLGEYKMEVFINDKLMKTFKYNVVAE
jgi:hypothetical protein